MNIKYQPLKRVNSAWNAHTNVATARKMPCLVSCAIRCLESPKTSDRERIKLSATLSQCDLRTGDWLRKRGQPGWLKWLQWVNLTSLSRLGRSNTQTDGKTGTNTCISSHFSLQSVHRTNRSVTSGCCCTYRIFSPWLWCCLIPD
jgi:hypothetical protein